MRIRLGIAAFIIIAGLAGPAALANASETVFPSAEGETAADSLLGGIKFLATDDALYN